MTVLAPPFCLVYVNCQSRRLTRIPLFLSLSLSLSLSVASLCLSVSLHPPFLTSLSQVRGQASTRKRGLVDGPGLPRVASASCSYL